jgi:hypothetical protein
MVLEGTSPVRKVLLAKTAQCQRMSVQKYCLGCIEHRVALVQPAVAEIAILGRGPEEGFIKTADAAEELRRHGHVVAGKEAGCLGVVVVEGINDVHNSLAGRGIAVVREAVDGPAPDQTVWSLP